MNELQNEKCVVRISVGSWFPKERGCITWYTHTERKSFKYYMVLVLSFEVIWRIRFCFVLFAEDTFFFLLCKLSFNHQCHRNDHEFQQQIELEYRNYHFSHVHSVQVSLELHVINFCVFFFCVSSIFSLDMRFGLLAIALNIILFCCWLLTAKMLVNTMLCMKIVCLNNRDSCRVFEKNLCSVHTTSQRIDGKCFCFFNECVSIYLYVHIFLAQTLFRTITKCRENIVEAIIALRCRICNSLGISVGIFVYFSFLYRLKNWWWD